MNQTHWSLKGIVLLFFFWVKSLNSSMASCLHGEREFARLIMSVLLLLRFLATSAGKA